MLLITGHQRSGTGYMAMLCQSMGLDVGHERPGEDGISSFQYAVNTDKVVFHSVDQNRGRRHYKFDRIIHVVRNPLHVIASTAFTDDPKATQWQSQFIPVKAPENHRVRQAVQTWLGWNELVETQTDERVRVEEADIELPRMLVCEPPKKPPPKNYNTREHGDLSWARLAMACTGDEFWRLQKMACRYGYET